jgi:hypothetical protein
MSPSSRLAHILSVPAIALALSACGAGNQATVADLTAHAPTLSTVSLDLGGATTVAPNLPPDPTAPTPPVAGAPDADPCHPHLFARTAEVAWRINAIFRRHLRHVDALVARHPGLVAGDTATWTQTGAGPELQRQFTMTRSADGLTYTFELSLAPAGQTPPAWTRVFSGSLADSVAGAVTGRTGAMTFDYDALRTVDPTEKLTGTVDLTFDRVKDPSHPAPGVKRTTEVTFHGFSFGPLDRHGPRDGAYTHLTEPGVGGLMSFQDAVVLLCPANPGALAADTATVARWFVAPDGAVHGRADAKAVGGQNPAGQTWLGVTCHAGAAGTDPATSTESAFWMMKLEDLTGATVAGSAHQAGSGVACDAAFGPVPSLLDASSDQDFSKAVTFPGAW